MLHRCLIYDVVGPRPGEGFEGGGFVVVGLNERMGHGSGDRHTETRLRGHRRRGGEPGKIAGACRQQTSLRPMRSAQAEVDQGLSLGGEHHAGSLRGNHGLEMKQIDQPGFQQLGLGERGGDTHDGLIGKEHRALGHGVQVAGEAQCSQIVQRVAAEASAVSQPMQLGLGETGVLQETDHLVQACGE